MFLTLFVNVQNLQFLGYANEIAQHFECDAHVKGYLHINGVDEYDTEMVRLLYNFDTEQDNATCCIKKIVDTYAYTQAAKGLFPYDVTQFVSNIVLHDMTENLTPKDYESFSRSSRSANYTTSSSVKKNSKTLSGPKISTLVEVTESQEVWSAISI